MFVINLDARSHLKREKINKLNFISL